MTTADELLRVVTQAKSKTSEVINDELIIDGETRTITVPDTERLFGVEGDVNVVRKHFRCPKIVGDNIDLSAHNVYIAYVFTDNQNSSFFPTVGIGVYKCEDVTVEGNDITFSWKLSGNVFERPGFIAFKMYAKKSDDDYETVFNTTPAFGIVKMTIPDGNKEIAEEYPDIINQLLTKMESVEQIATPEAMQGYVDAYLKENPVQSGATAEQVAQIEKNKTDISLVKEDVSSLSEDIGYFFDSKKINYFDVNASNTMSGITVTVKNGTLSANGTTESSNAVILFDVQINLPVGTYYLWSESENDLKYSISIVDDTKWNTIGITSTPKEISISSTNVKLKQIMILTEESFSVDYTGKIMLAQKNDINWVPPDKLERSVKDTLVIGAENISKETKQELIEESQEGLFVYKKMNFFDIDHDAVSSGVNLSIRDGILSVDGTYQEDPITLFISKDIVLENGTYYLWAEYGNNINKLVIVFDDYTYKGVPNNSEEALPIVIETGSFLVIQFFIYCNNESIIDNSITKISLNKDAPFNKFVEPSETVKFTSEDFKIEDYNFSKSGIKYIKSLAKESVLVRPTLFLPKKIYCTVGKEHSIFYEGMIKFYEAFLKGNYYIKPYCYKNEKRIPMLPEQNGFTVFNESINYTPKEEGTLNLQFEIKDIYTDDIISQAETMIEVTSPTLLSENNISLLYLGDSYADFFHVSSFLYKKLDEVFNSVTFVGTRDTDIDDVKDEAYGGWSTNTFVARSEVESIENPFWNPEKNKFDFKYYIEQNFPNYVPHSNVGDHLDIFVIGTGTNDIIYSPPGENIATRMSALTQIIDSIHEWDSEIMIICNTVPRLYSGTYAIESGTGDGHWKRINYAINLDNEHVINNMNMSNVFVSDTCMNYDSRFSLIGEYLNPNRYDRMYNEFVATDIHPNENGANYISDGLFDAIVGIMSGLGRK